jgi:ribosomal protein S18
MGNEKITQRRKRAMITIKEWMELVDYKITEGSDYGWGCYGPNSFTLDSWNGVHGKGGYSFSIVFSTKSQKVYEVSMCDYTNDRAYRMINPKFQKKHAKEAEMRNVNLNEAWDSVDYVDLDVLDDFIQKALAIRAGEDYDTRVQVPVDFSDEELLQYMKMAHERDMTFNEFVEEALRHALEEVKSGRLTKESAHKWLEEQNED